MATTRNHEFIIDGMTCAICTNTVRDASIKALEEAVRKKEKRSENSPLKVIENCAVALPNQLLLSLNKSCTLSDKEIEEILVTSLGDLSYGCARIEKPDPVKMRNHLIKGIVATVIGIGLMLSMFLPMTLGMGMPFFLIEFTPYIPYMIGAFSTLLTLYFGYDTYLDAAKKLFLTRKLNMNALFTVSTLTALGSSIASFFTELPNMFSDSLLIFGFRHVGMYIEEKAKQKVFTGLKFRQRAAKKVRKVFDAKTNTACDIECKAEDLIEGDIIYVIEKQIIPVDGICLTDHANEELAVYDNINSGATVPKTLQHGNPILAGMEVPNGGNKIKIKVTATENNSQLAKLDRNILQSQTDEKRKAPLQATADNILKWFIPAVFLIAAIAFVAVGFLTAPAGILFALKPAFEIAIPILVAACPCTFGFIVPLGIRTALNLGAQHGVIFKSGESLQAAKNIKIIALDLNGTITTGKPSVTQFKALASNEDELLKIIELLESGSLHPIAKAICEHAKNKRSKTPSPLIKLDSKISNIKSGRSAIINGSTYAIGDSEAMKACGIDTSHLDHLYGYQSEHIIYLAKDNQIVSFHTLHTPLRDGIKEAIRYFHSIDIDVVMVTGANQRTAQLYAAEVNLPIDDEHIFWGCESKEPVNGIIPANHKIHVIRKKQQTGKTAFIGDGANDCRVIQDGIFDKEKEAYCDLGIAIQADSSCLLTQQNASIIINGNSLKSLTNVFTISSQTISNIKINLVSSLAYNAVVLTTICVLAFGFGIAFPPALGVVLMVAQAALILGCVAWFQQRLKNQLETSPSNGGSSPSSTVATISKSLGAKPSLTPAKQPEIAPKIEHASITIDADLLNINNALESPNRYIK